jgi:hypothetical protein
MNGVVTNEMLDAAVKKAVEAGLLPRHACREDASGYQELIRYVLQAALEAAPAAGVLRKQSARASRSTIRDRFAEVRDMTQWLHGYAQR